MTSTSTTVTEIPGYIAGTWTIDPAHSDVSFNVRHMMVSKVRGHFTEFSGEIVTAENPLQSSVHASIALSSISTNSQQRDDHIRSADFFDVETYPTMTFTSKALKAAGDNFILEGELTLKGSTKPVSLDLELNGFSPDPWGGTRVGFSAKGELSRSEFGVDISMPMDGGGVVVGDKISLVLEIEAVLNQ